MNARTVRLPQKLTAEAEAYAKTLGISFNALAAVALRDYLDARIKPPPVEAPTPPPPRPVRAPAKSTQAPTGDRHAAAPRAGAGGAKVGRNEPCPCGSGQKFKRCHGAAGGESP